MTGRYVPEFPTVNQTGDVLNLQGLIIQKMTYNFKVSESSPSQPWVDLNFPQAFPNQCWTCFATNAQVGFSASDTISCTAISKSQCRVYQNNTANADMQLKIIAIGF